MNRKSFFKTLLGGAAVAVVAPRLLAGESDKVVAVDTATIPKGMSVQEVIKVYGETGTLPHPIGYDIMEGNMLRHYAAIVNGRDSVVTYYEG